MPISGIAPMRERQDNLNAEGIAADVVDELGLLGEPQAPHMIEAIARAIRRAVEGDRRRTRAIRLGKGLPQQFEEIAPGVRLWRRPQRGGGDRARCRRGWRTVEARICRR